MSNAAGETRDSQAVLRDKRAQGIAAMGLVTRECDRFRVATPALRGRTTKYEVWRDDAGCVRCSCLEYEEQANQDARFRCEHILAVKHSLLTSRTPGSNVLSLAKHHTSEEQEMTMQENRLAIAEAPESRDQEMALPAQPVGPVGFTNTLRALRQQIDPTEMRTRKDWADQHAKSRVIEYLEWHTFADILDSIVPYWSHSIRNVVQIGSMVVVTAAITIDGVTREGIGTGATESAAGIERAEHDALKRAALKFGIARDIDKHESESAEEAPVSPHQRISDPLAKSMADLVTPKQLGMMRGLAREAGVNVEDECQSIFGCQTVELSKHAASGVIKRLEGMPQVAAAGMRRAC